LDQASFLTTQHIDITGYLQIGSSIENGKKPAKGQKQPILSQKIIFMIRLAYPHLVQLLFEFDPQYDVFKANTENGAKSSKSHNFSNKKPINSI